MKLNLMNALLLICMACGAFYTLAQAAAPGGLATGNTSVADPVSTAQAVDMVKKTAVLDHLHHINQKEITMAQMALDKSTSPEVKSFAQRMVKDHTAADTKVQNVASTEGVPLQNFAPAGWEQATQSQLSQLSGKAFDEAYLDLMRVGHKDALDEMKVAMNSTHDPKIKALIKGMIPTVEEHETIASNYSRAEKNMAGQASSVQKDQKTHDRDTMNRDMNVQ